MDTTRLRALVGRRTTGRRSNSTAYVRGMERLLGTVQELSLARTLPDVQRIVRTAARALTGCDGATFVLRDNGQCHYADEDAIAPLWKGSRFPMEICISGWAMLNKQAVVIPDITIDPRIPQAAYRPTFVKSLVMVPIRTLDPIGAIGNYWAHAHQPSVDEVRLLQALADSTSVAMENVQVYAELEQRVQDRTVALERANDDIHRLAITDALTGLYNRRGFYQLGTEALAQARRQQRDGLLAFIDADGLKQVNDRFGHDAGDALLGAVARVLKQTLQGADLLARMGGDEFCVLALAPDADAAVLRERLYAAFAAFNREASFAHPVSASIGVVSLPWHETTDLDVAISRADQLMYAEKSTRRARRSAEPDAVMAGAGA